MNDWYNDPPEPPDIPLCCGDEMDVSEDGICKCPKCGKVIEPQQDWDVPDDLSEPYPPTDWTVFQCEKCPHGNEWGECGKCDHEGDLAYDAARERRRK
jgi:predicted RNA-binding Zn-ribbon protein involved in translation (DUF1610 family)|tara:strand:- start:190 stop:483 length:294 start_codon:yes stop_codon:yes gene_type:complete